MFVDPDGLAELIFVLGAKESDLSKYSKDIISGHADKAGIEKVYITSTQRTSAQQAQTMYKNLQSNKTGKDLYKDAGQQVEQVYSNLTAEKKSQAEITSAMEKKIEEVGPGNVSAHAGDYSKLQAVDIGQNVIDPSKKEKFAQELGSDPKISKFLKPPADPAFHVEIPQPQPQAQPKPQSE